MVARAAREARQDLMVAGVDREKGGKHLLLTEALVAKVERDTEFSAPSLPTTKTLATRMTIGKKK